MSELEWRQELIDLYKQLRHSPLWPENYNQILTWIDPDARKLLEELNEIKW